MLLTATTESKWCIFRSTELLLSNVLEERVKQAMAKLSKMSKEERQELAKQCFGMWKDRDDLPF